MLAPSIASFSIHGREAHPTDPYLKTWQNTGAGPGTLYGMVEVLAGPTRDVTSIVWEGIEEGLQARRSLTLTRYLQNIIRTAHENLAEYTGRGWRASVTLASINEDDLYLAWAGPSLTYLVAGGEVVRPGSGARLMPGGDGSLGDPREIPVHIAHESIAEGDVFVMAWKRLAEMVEDDNLPPLLDSGVEPALRSLYRMAGDQSEFALIILGFPPDAGQSAGP